MKFRIITSMMISGVAEVDLTDSRSIEFTEIKFDHFTVGTLKGEVITEENLQEASDPKPQLAMKVALLDSLLVSMRKELRELGADVMNIEVTNTGKSEIN